MKEDGYTLVEILVVLGIIGVLFSIGFASFRDFSRRQILAGVVKQMQADIRLAQQMSLSGQKPSELGCNTAVLSGIYFNLENSRYQIKAGCGDDPTQTSYPTIKEVTLPTGISVNTNTLTVNPILFKVLGQGTNISKGSSVIITFTQEITNNKADITVSSGGEIK